MTIFILSLTILFALLCLVYPRWGFLGYLAALLVRPNEMFPDLPLPVMPIMIVSAGAGILLNNSRALPQPEGGRSRSLYLMLGVLALLFVHLAVLRRHELQHWILSDVAQFALMLLYMARFFSEVEQLPTVLTGLMSSASLMALVPLAVHFLYKGKPTLLPGMKPTDPPSHGELWDSYHAFGRLMGKQETFWANANALGILVNWAMPGVLYHLRKRGMLTAKPIYLGLFGLLATTLILTGSRAGQLQLGIILWMIFVGGRRKALGIILLVVTMVGLVFVLPRLAPERTDAGASYNERAWVLSAGVAMFKSSPIFGIGFLGYGENSPRKLNAHNVYMQSLAETGVLGFALFLALIYYLRKETSAAVKYFDDNADFNDALAARCIGAMQFGFTVFAFFSNVFMTWNFAIPMTMAVGLYLAMLRHQQEHASSEAGEADTLPAPEPTFQVPPAPPPAAPLRLPAPAGSEPPALAGPAPGPEQPGGSRWVFDPAASQDGLQQLEEEPAGEPLPPTAAATRGPR